MQKRYYKIYGKYIAKERMQRHMAKVWHRRFLGSQSLQEVCERLDKAYRSFFNCASKRPPKFKSPKDFSSFVLKQSGYKFLEGNKLSITFGKSNKVVFKYSMSRDIEGSVKRLCVKRTPLGEFFICVLTDADVERCGKTHNGASAGVDFGLKTYMTLSDGTVFENPQFLKKDLRKLKALSAKLSRAKKGSNNREHARLTLCRVHEDICNKRRDFQWCLAHEMCRRYDRIFLEDLNMRGMTKLWGHKMNDLAHGEFVLILQYLATKYGCDVVKIDRYFPSSKLCDCGYKNDALRLSNREWVCPHCGAIHNRDLHAAQNILREGIRESESACKTTAVSQCGVHA